MKNLEFVKFPSLENTYQQKYIDKILSMEIKGQWIVTSKVHGANYSIWMKEIDGELIIKPAKRTSFISEDEKFFNHRPVFEKYKPLLEKLFYHLGCKELIVYGELYGGNIQQGMCYSLEQDFIAFDLKVDGIVWNKTQAFFILKEYHIPTVPVLGIFDTLEEALGVNEYYTSLLIRNGFNGDERHKEEEGIVIEPVTPCYEHNGSRVYLKKKTKRFMEKKISVNKTMTPVELDNKVSKLIEESKLYITESRFSSVVSKIGEVSIKDIGKVMGLYSQDVIIDLEKDLGKTVDEVLDCKKLKSQYMKTLQKSVQEFVKPILLSK